MHRPSGFDFSVSTARLVITVAAALLTAVGALEYAVGEPPVDGVGVLDWMETNRVGLILLDEALVFAGLALLAAAAVARSVAPPPLGERLTPIVGLTILATMIMLVTALAGGRFVYPVHDISVEDSGSATVVAGLFYGGMHMLWLAFGGLALTLVAVAGRFFGPGLIAISLVAAAAAVAASYPEALGPEITLVVRLVFVAWIVLLALKLPDQHAFDTSHSATEPAQ